LANDHGKLQPQKEQQLKKTEDKQSKKEKTAK